MKNDTSSALTNYFTQQRNARIVTEVVRDSLARTFIAKLIARTVVVGVGTALFLAISPTAGFIALAVGIFIL